MGKRARKRGHLKAIDGGKPDPVKSYRWPVPCLCNGTGWMRDKRGVLCVCVPCGLVAVAP